ncbi:MAG: hypothetical protein JNK37_00185 [Verrucomicrobiales bacterium]|nr:hypothetical protein [Verrucomicrobiales bacterium]
MAPLPSSRRIIWAGIAAAIAACLMGGTFLAQEAPKTAGATEQPCDGDVWCGLFVARAEAPSGAPADPAHAALQEKLAKAFPSHRHFQLVGEKTGSVYKEYECWIVPTKQLFLKLDSLGPDASKDGVHLHLQLWQEEHVILKSDAILRREPVFISGPAWGDGRLIMVLKLANDPQA